MVWENNNLTEQHIFMGVKAVKRYLCCFATMLLVFVITDLCLGGELFRPEVQDTNQTTAILNRRNESREKLMESRDIEEENSKELGMLIASKSCEFVRAAFNGDKEKVSGMLSMDTEYCVAEDNSSYIRHVTKDLHVEGYMATDRKLVQVRHCWYIVENDGTITSEVEVDIEGEKAPQTWYIHFRKSLDDWKIFMLENGI